MAVRVLEIVQLVLVGLLAGEELVVRYGLQPAMDALPDDAHVRARIAMVRRLKVVVPLLMLPTVLASAALVVVGGADGRRGASPARCRCWPSCSSRSSAPCRST